MSTKPLGFISRDEIGVTVAPITSPVFATNISTPYIVSPGALGITPASGSNVNVNLAGAGSFVVNTGNTDIDSTTNANQYGVITKDGTRFIHDFNYGNNGTVTTDGYNTFVGKNAGNLTMGSTATETFEGSSNTAVGNGALQVNTTGYNNTANGVSSLYSNTTGNSNTANGLSSLYSNTTGNSNTALGFQAGYNSGVALQTNTNSVFLGYGANSSVDGLTNAIAIGSSAQATQSNQVVLGNSSITQTLLRGNVGIGTTEPRNALDVRGIQGTVGTAISQSGVLSVIDESTNAVGAGAMITLGGRWSGAATTYFAGIKGVNEQGGNGDIEGSLALYSADISTGYLNERMRINSSGNVGIGTTTPSAQLHTTGTVRFQNFGAGSATFDANGNVSSASDERLKDIAGEFTVGLHQILGINPIQYHWNALSALDKDNLYTGFSAQNVRKFIPEAVSIDSNGYYNLQDRVLIAALVNSVKQLTIEIDGLRSELGLLKIDRTSADRRGDSSSLVKSKVAIKEKECGAEEIVKEEKEVTLDTGETKIVEVLKAGIIQKEGKYYRQESNEEAAKRYSDISQN